MGKAIRDLTNNNVFPSRMDMARTVQRIGVFDSGIGGLTVLKSLLELLPHTDMVYLGDCARLPYGTKSPKTIVHYSLQCSRFLASKAIDLLVVACNTASAHALDALEQELEIPVVGVIEAGARAVIDSGGRRVGVIGTPTTIRSGAYVRVMHEIEPDLEIISQACPLFVPLVEEGWFQDEITELVARRYLSGMIEARIDTLLLGCTHYPLLKGILGNIMGSEVQIIDSAFSIARVVEGLVGTPAKDLTHAEVVYYLSDLSPRFIDIGEVILGHEMKYVYDVDLCV
ncbi:MAG: glutamate racemase [Desulfomonilia bacterium]|nr:glutamate racemase [Desulfomonilia bacterium]